MIIYNNLTNIKTKFLLNFLQGNYRDSLGELNNTSNGVFEAKSVNPSLHLR